MDRAPFRKERSCGPSVLAAFSAGSSFLCAGCAGSSSRAGLSSGSRAFSSGSAQALVTARPLVAEHGLLGTQAGLSRCLSGLRSTGSVAAAHGLSCPTACGISAGQGWNPRLLR